MLQIDFFRTHLQQKLIVMKKQNAIRESYGLTQVEMAILLGITRGQWSMYECGKRELPTSAMLILSEMVVHLEAGKTKKATPKLAVKNETKAFVNALLKENKYQLAVASRELDAMERKHKIIKNANHLIELLNSKSKSKKTPDIHQLIASRITKNQAQNKATELTALQIRVAVLQAEETILKEKADIS